MCQVMKYCGCPGFGACYARALATESHPCNTHTHTHNSLRTRYVDQDQAPDSAPQVLGLQAELYGYAWLNKLAFFLF